MILCREVDNYLVYLTDLLREVFCTKPEVLRTGEQERLDFVLQFSTMDELIKALAERKVERLAFLGTKDLSAYFEERLGLDLLGDEERRKTVPQIIELRNIIVHNRSIVSPIFKRRVPDFPAEVGDRVQLTSDDSNRYGRMLLECVRDLDATAASKFGLSRVGPAT